MTKRLAVMPTTRGECIGGVRPCPWRTCRHWLDAAKAREPHHSETRNRPSRLTEETCSLDVADDGPRTFDEIGALLGLSHGRIQQIEAIALRALVKRLPAATHLSAEDLSLPWTRAECYTESDDWFDADFKAAVHRAYERIVPADERGSKALRSIHGGGERAAK